MNGSELREKSSQELQEELLRLRKEQFRPAYAARERSAWAEPPDETNTSRDCARENDHARTAP